MALHLVAPLTVLRPFRLRHRDRHATAILGMIWLVIRPSVMVVGATIVVRDMLGVSTGATPYPLSVVPEDYQVYMLLNPMTTPLMMIRWALFHTEPIPWLFLAFSAGLMVLANSLGIWFFLKWEARAIDG